MERQVAGKSYDLDIASTFANYFRQSVYDNLLQEMVSTPKTVDSDSILKWLLIVEDIDRAVHSLKCGKAAGVLTAECYIALKKFV